MVKSELHFLGHVVELLTIETDYNKSFNEYSGVPILYNEGGLLKFVFGVAENFTFLERMITINNELYKKGYPVDDGKIVFYDTNDAVVKTWRFKDAPIVSYKEKFNAARKSMHIEMVISPGIQDYGYQIYRNWHITPIEEQTAYRTPVQAIEQQKKKDPFSIQFSAKSSDIKNGVFGFDAIPNKNIVTSDYEKLKQEYKPLAEKILKEQYIPPWLSIRKGQTVELELNWSKKNNAADYSTIAFEPHLDFSFEPENLKNATKVSITCKNTNATAAQLLLKADADLIVGGLNVFYPTPKKIDLEWCFVEFEGADIDALKDKINKLEIDSLLKKGFNPALLDITATNAKYTTVNVSENYEKLKERKFFNKNIDIKGIYIEKSATAVIINSILNKHDEDKNKVTLYCVYKKCINSSDITEDGRFDITAGVSPTGTGIAFILLDRNDNFKEENTIHEIMHALGLTHTFESTHRFTDGKTDNYMDYNNKKKHNTYKWQWQKLHKYSKLK